MKLRQSHLIYGLSFFFVPLTSLCAQESPSGPTIGTKSPSGPSAKMAARLKYHPPENYLKHYLGDDRYKIAGGVWKRVSTQLDTYYHRATCPNMLKQSADIVIGFSGSADAEESGYRADPTCQPAEEAVIFGQAPGRVTEYLEKAQQLKLADGTTIVTVPAQWKRTASRSIEFFGTKMSTDTFKRKGALGELTITTFPVPGGGNAEQFLEQRVEQQGQGVQSGNKAFLDGMAATNPQMRGVGDAFAKPKKTKLGNALAYSVALPKMTVRRGAQMVTSPASRFIVAAKGSKLYMIVDSDGSKGAQTLSSSFKAP